MTDSPNKPTNPSAVLFAAGWFLSAILMLILIDDQDIPFWVLVGLPFLGGFGLVRLNKWFESRSK